MTLTLSLSKYCSSNFLVTFFLHGMLYKLMCWFVHGGVFLYRINIDKTSVKVSRENYLPVILQI